MRKERSGGGEPRKGGYEKPKLRRFGHIVELTLAIGNMGSMDGGMGKAHGTSL